MSEKEFPNVAEAIVKCFYVDDYTGGANSVEEAMKLYKELKQVFESFGFNLRKFMSNSAEFLSRLPECDKESQEVTCTKALGISWRPESDDFTFASRLNMSSNPVTKRHLFSEIASLYDPMG